MQIFSHEDQAQSSPQPRKRLSFRFVTLLIVGSLVLAALSYALVEHNTDSQGGQLDADLER